jgi:hypothetical protein
VLHAAGVPFHARTRGFADDPDVLLATRIARELGIEHQVDLTTEGPPPSQWRSRTRWTGPCASSACARA